MSDNSDYNKPRTNLYKLLPEVLQSETNETVFENTFNRFLTKQETERVAGYIGQGNPNAIRKRQIKENDVHRQGYQLQPILYNKIGSIEYMSSWKDILNEAERQGIERERLPEWLDLLKFNWVPPIDLDKFVNYRDYYWYDEDNTASRPQYITIRSRCSTAIARLNFYERLVERFGATIPTIQAGLTSETPEQFTVKLLDSTTNTIVVDGDATDSIVNQQYFQITGTIDNNQQFQAISSPTYSSTNNETIIPVSVGSIVSTETIGSLVVNKYDKLVVTGDLSSLLEEGFVFFYRDSSNTELNNAFWISQGAVYDDDSNTTTITIDTVFTNNIVDGVISQEEQLAAFEADRNCRCFGSVGWDLFLWGSAPEDPLWGDKDSSGQNDLQQMIDSISNAGPPTGTPADATLWWDTLADQLYEYNSSTGWVVIRNGFSKLLETVVGDGYWDYTPGCGDNSVIPAADQWINQNKWLHKSDVPNFSTAKQAQLPIIEYDWDLEINEWTFTQYNWKYRAENSDTFETTTDKPELIELIPLDVWTQVGEEIVLSEIYGDLTDYFTPGRQFMAIGVSDIFEVESSRYLAPSAGQPPRTIIKPTVPVTGSLLIPAAGSPFVSPTPLRPLKTSQGDPWEDYNVHWLFVGEEETVPVVHQPQNNLKIIDPSLPSTLDVTGEYTFRYTYYAQEATVQVEKNPPTFNGVTKINLTNLLLPGADKPLTERALIGFNDIRVYVNDIRQYGNYDEVDDDGFGYVTGIEFLPGFELNKFDIVRIEVGEASLQDFGFSKVEVRTIEDNTAFASAGTQTVSLIEYKKQEQVKTEVNQYPLFDMYNVDGTPAFQATPLFAYVNDPDGNVNPAIGQRVSTDTNELDYIFQQYLVAEDGTMYAYRDYSNQTRDFWINPETNQVYFWDGFAWSTKTQQGLYYTTAQIGPNEPEAPWINIDGAYWYDTANQQLFRREVSGSPSGFWQEVSFIENNTDPTLQTIWRKGLNDEKYAPAKRDWERRTIEEYNDQKDLFVESRADELLLTTSLTSSQAEDQAEDEWFDDQKNHLSTDGQWIGDWEIPDPLYYNYNHENRPRVTFRELLTHFESIVLEQPKIPGFNDPRESMFHLIPTGQVNYGVGGTIREYNHGFDTFLSTLFNNTVSPIGLFEYAQDQYEVLIGNLRDLYRTNVEELFLNVSTDSLADQSSFITEDIITRFEQNDRLGRLYGDSTTFTEVVGNNDTGLRNWIATLPYLALVEKQQPHVNIDLDNNINQVVHHDGHRRDYFLADATREALINSIINTPDERTRFPGPTDPPSDTFGRQSTFAPPNDSNEFQLLFNTTIIDREGVYWYQVTGTDRKLYRLSLVDISTTQPANTYQDGTLWLDLTPSQEVLRILETDPNTGNKQWNVVEGLVPGVTPIRLHNGTNPTDITTSTVAAWKEVSVDTLFSNVVLEAERKLFENVPDFTELDYDFSQLQQQYPQEYNTLLEQAFLAFANEREIITPFANTDYSPSDAFTWNYRYSSPGQSYEIVQADDVTDQFFVQGNVAASFGTGTQFYIKNSGVNDGFWRVSSTTPAFFDGTNTVIPVDTRPVVQSNLGVIYTGVLPSPFDPVTRPFNINDGSESGGFWQDLYQKLYQTPFPHLEPWKLQGYVDKPSWWEQYYLNDDQEKWGNRRWKYKHGFEIIGVDAPDNWFEVEGNFVENFTTGSTFNIDNSPGVHNGSWTNDSIENVSNVIPGTPGNAIVEIPNNYTGLFTPGTKFAVVSSLNELQQVLTVVGSTFTGPPSNTTLITVEEEIVTTTSYDVIGGATYTPSNNRTRVRVVENVTTSVIEGRIAKQVGMWYNIRQGLIPAGEVYPNGVTSVTGNPVADALSGINIDPLPTYNYFSVNIGNSTVTTGGTFEPDDVFPPYWDFMTHFGTSAPLTFDRSIRSVYGFFGEIQTPGATYVFGDAGPVEYRWRNSTQFLYDLLKIAYRLDPVRFTYSTFGPEYYNVGGLLVDKRLERVLSHTITDFHGDIVDNQVIKFDGTNQWYVNFARFIGLDISMSDFRSQWTDWTAPMMYQFASFIDTPSLDVDHRTVAISNFDYRITAKRSNGVEDYWTDAFNVVIVDIPPKIARYNNENDWTFEIRTASPGKPIQYFDVRNYQFHMDPSTNTGSLFTWDVVGVDIFNQTFSINGDQREIFVTNTSLDVTGSTGNDGTYTVVSSAYDPIANNTIIEVEEDLNSITADGLISTAYRTLPFTTGDRVVVTSRETLPVPLIDENENGIFYYFVIVESPTEFKLARTENDANTGNAIDITSVGTGDHFIGQISTTFETEETNNFWRHYVVDEDAPLRSFTPPHTVRGIQQMINIVDGYERFQETQGWRYNADSSLKDFERPSRTVSYQLELERFIDFLFTIRLQRRKVDDRFDVTVDETTDVWTFTGSTPQFVTGDPVTIIAYDNLLPTPLFKGGRYYIIRDSLTAFRLAATRADAQSGNPIDITSVAGVNNLFLTSATNLTKDRPIFEINPHRHAIWYRPERGIVSNIFQGPQDDAFSSQLIFDQYGRILDQDKVQVFRLDKETTIRVQEGIPNDVTGLTPIANPYNNLHLSSLHLFIDTFEHVMIFNNETTEGNLLYDPFIGLNVTKFELLFNRQLEFTQRPNVGGQYLSTFFNQGADLSRNIEASVEDLRLLYDTFRTIETNQLVEYARDTLGYEGTEEYLDLINVTAKSQFNFWRGAIQNKGSINSVKAYVNSRRFIDARVDEFWAYKIAEFGSDGEKEYISMYLSTEDARSNELKLQFVTEEDLCLAGYDRNNYNQGCGYAFPNGDEDLFIGQDGFTPIALTDQNRWFEQPDQLQQLRNNGGTLYFELKPVSKIPVIISSTAPTQPRDGDGWVDTSSSTYQFNIWDADLSSWIANGEWNTTGTPLEAPLLRHNFKCDYITITLDWTEIIDNTGSPLTGSPLPEIKEIQYIPFADSIRVFKDGVQLDVNDDYIEVTDGSTLLSDTNTIAFKENINGSIIEIVHKNAKLERNFHFEELTSNIVKLNYPDIISPNATNFNIWGWIVDKESLNPQKIIDTKSETVITPVQIWDPARGFHYYNALHIVDLQNENDPAIYNQTPLDTQIPAPAQNFNLIYNNPWNKTEVGTTWLDLSLFDYIPYYDTGAIPDIDERLRLWGRLADWAELKIYTWVESDVPPEEWNALAEIEEGDASIPQQQRKSGRVKQTLFERDLSGSWVRRANKHDRYDVSIEGTGAGTNVFTLNEITPNVVNIVETNSDDNTIIIEGDFTRRMFEGTTFNVAGITGSPSTVNGLYIVESVSVSDGNTEITVSNVTANSTNEGEVTFYEPVNTYINGITDREELLVSPNGQVTFTDLLETDRVDIIQLVPTDEDFIAAEVEAGNLLQEVEHTTDIIYDNLGIERTRYYFWVENKATRGDRIITPFEAQQTLEEIPIPYVFFQGVREELETTFGQDQVTLPVRFVQAVIRGVRGIINDDLRYILRWTRDFTLRDSLEPGKTPLQKKNLHEEWTLIRPQQQSSIPVELWNKVTESIVGFKLNDPTVRVPSLEREFYDEENGTDTRFGLRDGQAFVDGELALQTVLAFLNDPNNDFSPVDINVFFQNNSFDTPENIIQSMNTIYNTFPFLQVNKLFFELVLDAFSTKRKYPDIFKTSYIALVGVRPFQVQGVFDD